MYSLEQWSNANPNTCYFLAGLSGANSLVVSEPGMGKSQSVLQFKDTVGKTMDLVIASAHGSEDFTGLPHPNEADGCFDYMQLRWIKRGTQPNHIWFLDEITTPPVDVRAPIMSILSEREVGGTKLADDLVILAACNPEHLCPNGSPLEASLANRMAWFDWKPDWKAWEKGMMSDGDNWELSFIPKPPANWRRGIGKWGNLMVQFLRRHTSLRKVTPDDANPGPYPTPRTWDKLRKAMSMLESVNAPVDFQNEMMKAFVGDVAAKTFRTFIAALDLVDPETALRDPTSYTYDKKRPDLAIALMTSITTAVASNYTDERCTAAFTLFCDRIGKHNKELALSQIRSLYESLGNDADGNPRQPPREAQKVVATFGKSINKIRNGK